jgi:hypothetical protein
MALPPYKRVLPEDDFLQYSSLPGKNNSWIGFRARCVFLMAELAWNKKPEPNLS